MVNKDVEAFITFQDWIQSQEQPSRDWIEVAGFYTENSTDYATFSAMAPHNPETVEILLSEASWEIFIGSIGIPFFDEDWETKEITYCDGRITERDGVLLEPFIIYRYFHDLAPARFDISQEFILYHNLDFDGTNYVDPFSENIIVKYLQPKRLQIRTIHLRDFLAAKKAVLVRYHDHRRSTAPFPQDQLPQQHQMRSGDRYYDINVQSDLLMLVGDKGKPGADSRLLGKDITHPFDEPKHQSYLELKKEEQTFTEYLVGLDERGNEVLLPCDESHFLTPIFFRPEVFQKYRDNPRLYSIEPLYLRCLDLWGIPYSRNEEGLVHVWLGDLGRIPLEEQLHWKSYNVLPSGGLEEKFYKTQIEGQFVDIDEPHYVLLRHIDRINEAFVSRFEWPLFRKLGEDESYIYKIIHPPLANELKEFSDQLLYLSKVLQDSLNVSRICASIVDQSKLYNAKGDRLPPITILEAFLLEAFSAPSEIQAFCESLRTLQSLRSLVSAHRLNRKEFQKTIAKTGLIGSIRYFDLFNQIVQNINSALQGLLQMIGNNQSSVA